MTVSKDPRYAKYFQMVKVVSFYHEDPLYKSDLHVTVFSHVNLQL